MKQLVLLFAVFALLAVPAGAESIEGTLSASFGVDALEKGLPDEAAELLEGLSPTDKTSFSREVNRLISEVILHSEPELRRAAASAASVLAICLLCGLSETERNAGSAALAGLLAIASLMFSDVGSLIRVGTDAISELSVFSGLLLPTMTAAAAASGAVTSAPAVYSLAAGLGSVLLKLVSTLLSPLLSVFLALALADAVASTGMLKKLRELIAWVIRTFLKAFLSVFTAFLAVTGIVTSASDTLATKAAKAALSGAVPVVGSILSDATETMLAGAVALKSSVGVYGMLAVIAICILPYFRIAISFVLMKAAGALAGVVAQPRLTGLIEAICEALSLLLAAAGACALLVLISTVCLLKAVGM